MIRDLDLFAVGSGGKRVDLMAKDPGSQYKKPIQEMRRLACERFGSPDELQQLRARIVTERKQAQRTILKKIADRTQIDVTSILDNDRGRREARRHAFSSSTQAVADSTSPIRTATASNPSRLIGIRADCGTRARSRMC